MNETAGPILLYDGACALCATTVQFILRRDAAGPLRFASLGGTFGRQVLAAHPQLDGIDSIVWIEDGGSAAAVLTRSAAAIRIARYLGGAWRLASILTLVPRPLRDRVYDLIARHRHRLMGAAPACVVPPPQSRHRFIDDNEP